MALWFKSREESRKFIDYLDIYYSVWTLMTDKELLKAYKKFSKINKGSI